MARGEKKRIVLFARISEETHEALRYIAYREKRSIANITREAIDTFLQKKKEDSRKQ